MSLRNAIIRLATRFILSMYVYESKRRHDMCREARATAQDRGNEQGPRSDQSKFPHIQVRITANMNSSQQ